MEVLPVSEEKLRLLVEEIVEEKLLELFGDPDEGLEVLPELIERLKKQRKRVKVGERGIPLEEAVRALGLE